MSNPPIENCLRWLIEALEKERQRYRDLEADCWSRIHEAKTRGMQNKAKAQLKGIHHVLNNLSWLLSPNRPWVRASMAAQGTEWRPSDNKAL